MAATGVCLACLENDGLPMKVLFQFDTDDEQDRAQMRRILRELRLDLTEDQLAADIAGVLSTVSGERILLGGVQHFEGSFTATELAEALGEPVSRIQAWIRVLGKTSARLGYPLLESAAGDERSYSIPDGIREVVGAE